MLRTAAIQVFLVHIFFIMKETDIANYVDDNTPYISADNIAQLINLTPLMKHPRHYSNVFLINVSKLMSINVILRLVEHKKLMLK